MEKERIESLTEILETLGVLASEDQIKQIAEDFALHLEMEQEMNNNQHVDRSDHCEKCEGLKKELSSAVKDSELYMQFIKKEKRASWVGISNGAVHGTYN